MNKTINKLLATILLLITYNLYSASVVLEWDVSTDVGVGSYKVHFGTNNAAYDFVVDAGNNSTATVSGLIEGVTYYFVCTAIGTNQLESDFSNEIAYTAPLIFDITIEKGLSPNVILSWPQHIAGILQYKLDISSQNWINSPTYTNNPAFFDTRIAPIAFFRVWATNIINQPTTNMLGALDYDMLLPPMDSDNDANGDYVYHSVESANPSSSGLVTYSFDVTEAGNYILAVDMGSASGGNNSLFLDINNDPVTEPVDYKAFDSEEGTSFNHELVSWRGNGDWQSYEFDPVVWSLPIGTNTVYIRGREINTKLYNIYLIKYVP